MHVRAESFLYRMVNNGRGEFEACIYLPFNVPGSRQVRNITGALHAVGAGRLPASAIQEILEVSTSTCYCD